LSYPSTIVQPSSTCYYFRLSAPQPPTATPFPYTTLVRSGRGRPVGDAERAVLGRRPAELPPRDADADQPARALRLVGEDRRRERSEEHTSELQSREKLVCRLLLEKKTKKRHNDKMSQEKL